MRKLYTMSILTLLLSVFSCQSHTSKDKGYESLSVEAYEQAISDTTVVRLDVRTAEEFAEGHIERALNIDVLQGDFLQRATSVLPKGKTVAVNCRSGKRSKNAAKILVGHGYKVIELDPGYNGWVAAGKKVVK